MITQRQCLFVENLSCNSLFYTGEYECTVKNVAETTINCTINGEMTISMYHELKVLFEGNGAALIQVNCVKFSHPSTSKVQWKRFDFKSIQRGITSKLLHIGIT